MFPGSSTMNQLERIVQVTGAFLLPPALLLHSHWLAAGQRFTTLDWPSQWGPERDLCPVCPGAPCAAACHGAWTCMHSSRNLTPQQASVNTLFPGQCTCQTPLCYIAAPVSQPSILHACLGAGPRPQSAITPILMYSSPL